MPLQPAMQRRPCQMRDRRLQRIKAIVQRQQRMTSKGNDHRFFSRTENGRTGVRGSGLAIFCSFALVPLGNRFEIDTKFPAQRSRRCLRSLYCCSDSVRGRGAAVTYLSHDVSFHFNEWIAPSNPGIKHLTQSHNRNQMAQGISVCFSCASGGEFFNEINDVGQLKAFKIIARPGT